MKSLWISVFAIAALVFCGINLAPDVVQGETTKPKQSAVDKPEPKPPVSPQAAVKRGIDWLVSVQGNDGGWGQDGGETSFVRQGERLETSGNDVANTAVATLALIQAGHTPDKGKYQAAVRRGLDFVLRHVEESPQEGLAVTSLRGTQIQRKLGPYIDTFLTSTLLAEIDGEMRLAKSNERVRLALQKCVNKIENNQQADGSWNLAGGWAPILGTAMASRSLFEAKQKGLDVDGEVLARVDDYTKASAKPAAVGPGVAGGRAAGTFTAGPSDAGVALYKGAQVLEQLSRTEEDRKRNAKEIAAVSGQLSNASFVRGFGSMGGEEFFSYLNISDSLHRTGGKEWQEWNPKIKTQLIRLQNEDGSWAGHHCITGRVAVTSAAILTVLVEQTPVETSHESTKS